MLLEEAIVYLLGSRGETWLAVFGVLNNKKDVLCASNRHSSVFLKQRFPYISTSTVEVAANFQGLTSARVGMVADF